jgi:hypothetical protein
MNKSILVLLLITTSPFVLGQSYDMYICPNHVSVDTCNSFCKPSGTTKLSFMVDKNSKSVMLKSYGKDGNPQSDVKSNCSIFDNKNWSCEQNPIQVETRVWMYISDKMTDGRYVHKTYYSDSPTNPSNEFKGYIGNWCTR